MTQEQSEGTKLILLALQSAECGQCVYNALLQIPTENLHDMWEMIEYILTKRGIKSDARFTIQ
jgi:hypothetical protein